MANPSYTINYDDRRFTDVEAEKKSALSEMNSTYDNMIGQSDKYYQDQINAAKDYANTQQQLQQQQTDFAIEKIKHEKDQAQKDYTKEQAGAYVDWQKQSNQFGANAEQMAAGGLQNTGFSESSQVSMYNAYQNRVAVARESFNKAVLNYDNAITEARLQNNSKLAEIAFQALQTELELSLQGFQYKNQLILEQANKKQELDNTYYNRYQDVLNQMNQENALAEEVRQYNENLELQKQQLQEEIRQYEQNYSLQVKQYEEGIRQFNEEIARLKAKDAQEYQLEIQQLELQKQQLAQQKAQADREYQLKQQQLAEEKRQFDASLSASRSSGGSSGGSSGSTSISKSSAAVNTPYYQGPLNPDTKYGTFKTTDRNGKRYQPNNVGGKKLSKAGLTIENNGVTQNVWKSSDGKYYYWEGRQNKYIQLSSSYVKALKKMVNAANAFR